MSFHSRPDSLNDSRLDGEGRDGPVKNLDLVGGEAGGRGSESVACG